MHVAYRVWSSQDISGIVKVQYNSQRVLEFKDLSLEVRNSFMLNYSDLYYLWVNRYNKKGRVYVAYDKDFPEQHNVFGFIFIKLDKNSNIGYISCFYVNPQYISQGIGSGLLQVALEDLFEGEEVFSVRLAVYSNNTNALNFYERRFFKETYFIYPPCMGEDPNEVFKGIFTVKKLALSKGDYHSLYKESFLSKKGD